MSIKFKDYSKRVNEAMKQAAITWLEEASGELESQTKRNTKVDTGQTKGSWEHVVHEGKFEAEVGSRYKNALWEEFGTGIYALHGDGRKNKWVYKSPKDGKFYATVGKKPRRAMHNAYQSLKESLKESAREKFKEL